MVRVKQEPKVNLPVATPPSPGASPAKRPTPGTVPATATDDLDRSTAARSAATLGLGALPGGATVPPGSPTADDVAANLRSSPAYRQLSASERAAVDKIIAVTEAAGSSVDIQALQRIFASKFWQVADAGARGEMLSLLAQAPHRRVDVYTSHQGRAVDRPTIALAELAERELNGRPALLDLACGGRTLVSHLAELGDTLAKLPANHPVPLRTGLSPSEILGGCILEVNDPGRLAQENVGTCGATSLQLITVRQNPAEYVRLCTGLIGPGTVKMRSGETLRRDKSSISQTPGSCRTPTERLFQSAVMEFGSPANYKVRVRNKALVGDIQSGSMMDRLPAWLRIFLWILVIPGLILTLWPSKAGGLTAWELDRAAEGLSGKRWEILYASMLGLADLSLPKRASTIVNDLLKRHPDGNFANDQVVVAMHWGTGFFSGHFLKLERIDPEGTPNRKIYFHNPWGSMLEASPGDIIDPGEPDVRMVEPAMGIVSMPLDRFEQRVIEVHVQTSEAVPQTNA
jgi:hypothetical protein